MLFLLVMFSFTGVDTLCVTQDVYRCDFINIYNDSDFYFDGLIESSGINVMPEKLAVRYVCNISSIRVANPYFPTNQDIFLNISVGDKGGFEIQIMYSVQNIESEDLILENTMKHVFGHMIGLGHNESSGSIMNGKINSTQVGQLSSAEIRQVKYTRYVLDKYGHFRTVFMKDEILNFITTDGHVLQWSLDKNSLPPYYHKGKIQYMWPYVPNYGNLVTSVVDIDNNIRFYTDQGSVLVYKDHHYISIFSDIYFKPRINFRPLLFFYFNKILYLLEGEKICTFDLLVGKCITKDLDFNREIFNISSHATDSLMGVVQINVTHVIFVYWLEVKVVSMIDHSETILYLYDMMTGENYFRTRTDLADSSLLSVNGAMYLVFAIIILAIISVMAISIWIYMTIRKSAENENSSQRHFPSPLYSSIKLDDEYFIL